MRGSHWEGGWEDVWQDDGKNAAAALAVFAHRPKIAQAGARFFIFGAIIARRR
jgi:hypothetical protein